MLVLERKLNVRRRDGDSARSRARLEDQDLVWCIVMSSRLLLRVALFLSLSTA